MEYAIKILILALAYFIGSIPFGALIVKISTGKDIRRIESGRTGGTNAMRAAGPWAGALTGLCDLLKGTVAVLISRYMFPDAYWLHVFAGLAAVLGHNYSVFLMERRENGRIRLHGGAGGAPTSGGAIGLWPPIMLVIAPLGILIWYFIGYASITTLSFGVIITLVFIYRAANGASPWEYVAYGVIAEGILVLALRPNIRRLMRGEERLVGFRARRRRKKAAAANDARLTASSSPHIPNKPTKN